MSTFFPAPPFDANRSPEQPPTATARERRGKRPNTKAAIGFRICLLTLNPGILQEGYCTCLGEGAAKRNFLPGNTVALLLSSGTSLRITTRPSLSDLHNHGESGSIDTDTLEAARRVLRQTSTGSTVLVATRQRVIYLTSRLKRWVFSLLLLLP